MITELHKCQYCGCTTHQSDDECWNNPKNHKFAEGEDNIASDFHEANKQCDACNAMCRIEGWAECWDLCTCKCHAK